MAEESRIIPEPDRLREDRMIREERWADIHHAWAVEHWSVSRIAREFDVDRKTVRECLRQPAWQPYTRQAPSETLLTQHADFLKARAPEVRYSARILFQELQKQHQYAGGAHRAGPLLPVLQRRAPPSGPGLPDARGGVPGGEGGVVFTGGALRPLTRPPRL